MASALEIVQNFFPDVNTIKDATQAIRLEITPKDCRTSGRKKHQHCAVAEACKRSMGADGVVVSKTRAFIVKGKTAKRYTIPTSVQKEIVAFDRGARFEPGMYSLSAPTKSERLGNYGHSEHRVLNRTNKKRFHHHTEGIRTSLQGG